MKKIIKTVVSIVIFLSSLLVSGGRADAKPTGTFFDKDDKRSLVLQHASEIFSKKDGKFDVARHYSHSSHYSHYSHSSHYSHYSHYSSRW